MAAPQPAGMDKAELKKLLGRSKQEPVNCAIGIGKDKNAAIMLDKTKQPKALLKEIEKDAGTLTMPRWGTASVDEDVDPKLVVFTVNAAGSGLGRKLKAALKGTGYSKVEIRLEDGSVAESVGEEDDADADAPQADGGQTASAEPVETAQATAPADMNALHAELARLIPLIPGAASGDPALLGTFKQLAGAANTALKGGDGDSATKAVAALKDAIDKAPQPQAPATPTAPQPTVAPQGNGKIGDFVAMQKSRLIWDSTRKRVASEVAGLKKAVQDEFDGDPEEAIALDALGQLDDILGKLDERLLDALDDLLQETDPSKHAALRDDCKELISEYMEFTSSNTLLQGLDGDTPFGTKLTIASTINGTLKALQSSLR